MTPRQCQVAELVAAGLANKEIARCLGLSVPTIRNYIEQIMRRLGFQTRTQLGVWIATHGRSPTDEPGRWERGA